MKIDKHFKVSMVKSAIRIVGYAFLPINLIIGALLLIFAEVLGIVEEL